ncbi:hypothetical protein [Polyangium sp. y55x31]|uniref:DUF6892 domain-containing protein n=1 Tax=Polyangium sp. y55x31 TaxID=3042688 RepID=UPI00248246D1|nr:hypothetical protein [Polyangium sp. y55x31]MDI1475571.1 hypothetical protein [Polyangium sp. y55x31]
MTTKKPTTKTKEAAEKNETRIVLPDPGLHIAVLGALMEAEVVDRERIEAKLEGIEGDDETERLRAAMARLHSIKLDRKKVARLDRLDFDGGNEIYMMMESGADAYTGGEDDTYSLRSLAGISALEGLETLDLDGHGFYDELRDLRPLEGLAKLTHLTLTGDWTHAASLETLPKLAHLDVGLGSVDDAAVLDRLAARGVEVLR